MKGTMRILNYLLLSALLVFPLVSKAQSDQEEIKSVIARLFTGMQRGDSAMVHSVFSKSVTMATAFRNRDQQPVLRQESSIQSFLNAVGTPHDEVWNEEIWDLTIRIDGDLASAWCNFAFYRGKTFSHCGVNSFHLHRTAVGWKIFHLADSRRTADCVIPAAITSKYK